MTAAVSPSDPHPAEILRGETLDSESPWPFLEPYREGDATFFRGRHTERLDLFLLVRREILTVLFGLSGLGKTSLLFAGLFPAVREEAFLPVYVRINHDERAPTPVRQVIEAMKRAAAERHYDTPRDDVETLWEYFHREDELFWSPANEIITPVLVFDQFEECFVEGQRTVERARRTAELFTQIADLVEARPPANLRRILDTDGVAAQKYDFDRHRYRTLISLRQDYLAELEELRETMPSVANRFHLKRMTGETALVVVRATGLVTDDAAEAIVRYVASESSPLSSEETYVAPIADLLVEPALLSLFCSQLNVLRRNDHAPQITRALFEENREKILESFYQRCMATRSAKVQMFVEDELLTRSGSRKPAALEDVLGEYGDIQADIDALIDQRLLRREKRDGLEWVELAHDRLTEVVQKSRDERHLQQEVARAEERARQEQQRRVEAEQREAQRRRELRRTQCGLAIIAALCIVAVGMCASATRQEAVANYQSGQFRAQEGRAQSALAHLASAVELYSTVDVHRWLSRSAPASLSSTALFSGLLYTAWPVGTLTHVDGFSAGALAGTRLVTIGDDSRVRVWDTSARRLLDDDRTYGDARAAFLGNDGKHLLTASRTGAIRAWDVELGKPLPTPKETPRIECAAFRRDGVAITVTSAGGPPRVVRVEGVASMSGVSTTQPGSMQGSSCSVAASDDGTRAVVGSSNGLLQLWDLATDMPIATTQHGAPVTAVAISADHLRVVSVSSDGVARLWNEDLGTKDSEPKDSRKKALADWQSHEQAVRSVAFSPDGTRFVTASDDRTAQVWDLFNDRKQVRRGGPPLRHEAPVASATFNETGTEVVTAAANRIVQIWDVTNVPQGRELSPSGAEASNLVFSADGARLAAAQGSTLRVWDMQTGAEVLTLAHLEPVSAVALDRSGGRIVTGAEDCTVRLWDGRKGELIRVIGRHGAEGDLGCTVQTVAFDETRDRIVSGSEDLTVLIWDAGAASGKPVGELLMHDREVRFVGSSAGAGIVTASLDGVQRWDVHNGKASKSKIAEAGVQDTIWTANLSSDGRYVVFGSEGCTAEVRDLDGKPSGLVVRHPQASGSCAVKAVSFAPDASMIATGSNDGTARLWDVATATRVGELLWHPQAVTAVAFSPDGRQLATASDGTVRLWEVSAPATESPKELAEDAKLVAGSSVEESWVDGIGKFVGRMRGLLAAPDQRIDDGVARPIENRDERLCAKWSTRKPTDASSRERFMHQYAQRVCRQ